MVEGGRGWFEGGRRWCRVVVGGRRCYRVVAGGLRSEAIFLGDFFDHPAILVVSVAVRPGLFDAPSFLVFELFFEALFREVDNVV